MAPDATTERAQGGCREGTAAMGLEKPREPVLENGVTRDQQEKAAEGPTEVHTPHSKMNKRIKEMIEKRGGTMAGDTFRALNTQRTGKRETTKA